MNTSFIQNVDVIDEFENRTRDAGIRATAAGQRALDAQEKVGTILAKLPEDKNKIDRLANTVAKTDKNIADATSQGELLGCVVGILSLYCTGSDQLHKCVWDIISQNGYKFEVQIHVIEKCSFAKNLVNLH